MVKKTDKEFDKLETSINDLIARNILGNREKEILQGILGRAIRLLDEYDKEVKRIKEKTGRPKKDEGIQKEIFFGVKEILEKMNYPNLKEASDRYHKSGGYRNLKLEYSLDYGEDGIRNEYIEFEKKLSKYLSRHGKKYLKTLPKRPRQKNYIYD